MAVHSEAKPLQRPSSRIPQESHADEPQRRKTGLLARLGNLPEWTIHGKHMEGAALNSAIGFIASCGFLMFGFVTQCLIAELC